MKKTFRKPLAVLLAAVFTLMIGAGAFPALLPRAFADEDEISSGECGDSVWYTWNKTTGAVTISGSGPMWDYDSNTFDGNPSPFYWSDNVKTVVIDYGVTSVGEWAFFFCESLESVTLPQGLTTIGSESFADCGLTSVTIPGTVTQIGQQVFYSCDLTSVTIPKSLTAIPAAAFANNENLQTLNYTGSPADWAAVTVADNAFFNTPVSGPTCYYYGVEGAENAINDVGVNDGSDAYLARLATAYVAFNKLSDGDKAKVTNADVLQAAIDAASGYEFGQCGNCVGYAWNKTTGAVTISGSGPMWDYDSNTFEDNPSPFLFSDNVTTVVIDYGVTSVGEFTFAACVYLESVTFPDDGSFKTIGKRAFIHCSALPDVTLPRGLTAIGESAFEISGLTSVTIPGTVTQIGKSAFYGIDSLTSVTIPKSVTEIPNGAFAYCDDLETINYTGSPADWAAMTIHENAFNKKPVSAPTSYYYGVEGVENAIADIGENDGSNAYKVRVAVADSARQKLKTMAEQNQVANMDLLVSARDTLSGYDFAPCGPNTAYAWHPVTGNVVIGGFGPTSNDFEISSPFADEEITVQKLSVEPGVTALAAGIFQNCSKLTSVTLSKGLSEIGAKAFADCGTLKTLNYTGGPADWAAVTVAQDAFDGTPVSAPTCYYYGVEGATNAINEIGTVEFTAECDARLAAARTAFGRLTDAEKALVTNAGVLTAAETAFTALQAQNDTGKALQLKTNGLAANLYGKQNSNIRFGNYMQSSASSKEPVKWRVLSNADGKLFLLSDQNLDVVRYNEESTSVTWATCTLRKWLNNYENHPYDDSFITGAFSDKEAAAIAETAVVNDKNPSYSTPGGENTIDKVFLLSIAEAKTTAYGFMDNNNSTETREATNTEYVHSGGHTGDGINDVGDTDWWWLRSPGGYGNSSSVVLVDGYLDDGGRNVARNDVAVRPAFNLNLNSVLFTSAAVNGKPGDGALTKIADNAPANKDWKLTLLDDTRAFAVTETAANVTPGGTVTLTYSGATVGTDEYISAILADETGAAVYYGRLAQPTAADGTLTVTVPADLALGSYTLKVFSEQYNGDYQTDYASAFCDVALTVATQAELDQAAADAVEALIAAIGTVTYTDECKGKIDAAKAAYEALTDEQKALVDPDAVTAMNDADAAYNTLKAVSDVETLIDAIGTVTYDAACKGRIDEARKAYDRLSKHEMLLVTNHETLFKAEDAWKALEAEALIDAIGTVEYTDASKEKIDAAKAAYNALTDEQKALVDADAVTALTDAEDKYVALEAEALIDAIGTPVYTDECKAKIDEARAAFDALTPAQQALVENADVLTAAEARYDELKAEAEGAATEEPSPKGCPVCGRIHNHGPIDRLVGFIHRTVDLIRWIVKFNTYTTVCG